MLIAVANDFYGWGIVARLANMESITEIDNVSSIVNLAKQLINLDVGVYVGSYANAKLPFKLTFTQKDKTLLVQATGQNPVEVQALGNHTFQYAAEGAVFEFKPDEKKMILRQGGEVLDFTKEQ
jgi:hypothetical protein